MSESVTDPEAVRLPDIWWADLTDLLAVHEFPVPKAVYRDDQTSIWLRFRLTFDSVFIPGTPGVEPEEPGEPDSLLADMGLAPPPAPKSVLTPSSEDRTIDYPDLLLMVARPGHAWAPFEHFLAAQRLADGLPDLPLMPFSHTLTPPDSYRPMVIRSLPRGRKGRDLLSENGSEVFEAIGRLIDITQSVWGPHVSMVADREQFLPAASWSQAGLGRVAAIRAVLAAQDVHLGVVQKTLLNRLETNLRSLRYHGAPCLVHFALGPDTVRFESTEQGLRVTEVEGFEHAVLGDPLAEWGAALRFGPEAVAAMLKGAGNPDLLAEPQGRTRLQVGFDLFLANTLATEAIRWGELELRERGEAAYETTLWIAQHLREDVTALLNGSSAEAVPHLPLAVGGCLLQLAWMLGAHPRVALRETEVLASAMALIEIDERFQTPGALEAACTTLESLGRGARAAGWGAHPDEALEQARGTRLPEGLLGHLAAEVVSRLTRSLGDGFPPAGLAGATDWLVACASFSFGHQPMAVRYARAAQSCWCAVDEPALRHAAAELTDVLELLPPCEPLPLSPAEEAVAAAVRDPAAPMMLLGLLRLQDLALLPCPLDVAFAQAMKDEPR